MTPGPDLSLARRAGRWLRLASCAAAASVTLPFCRYTRGADIPGAAQDPDGSLAARARADLTRWRESGNELARPLLILSGYRAPGTMGGSLAWRLRRLLGIRIAQVRLVSYPHRGDMDRIARLVGSIARREFPHASSFDVIGISMGGLIARMLHSPAEATRTGTPPLVIDRLFTLATPHRGARLAERIRPDRAATDMRAGSARLQRLDQSPLPAVLRCYTILNDITVGAPNTAPHGTTPIWVPGTPFFSHSLISEHPLIVLDLALNLAGLTPLLTPAPLPKASLRAATAPDQG